MQQLSVNLSIAIPEDMVLIQKIELEELKEQSLTGVYWNMGELAKRTNKSTNWLKDNILYQPKFKKELDSRNGGCVFYPQAQGQPWAFKAKEMAIFLDKNFHRIFN